MFLPPPLKSSPAIRAASTEPMPLVSWKMPEISLSTPTRATSPEIWAWADCTERDNAAQDNAIARLLTALFITASSQDFFVARCGSRLPPPSAWVRSGRCDRNGKVFEPAQRVVVASLHRTRDLDGPNLARQCGHHALALEPGDQQTDAHVNPRAVSHMPAGFPRHVIAVGIVPTARIAVGRPEEHQDLFALADCMTADFEIPSSGAEERLHRALEPHGFFERV